jgi:hypothetical protein
MAIDRRHRKTYIPPMTDTHPDSEIIDDLGGTAEVSRLCQVKSPSVSEWRRTGIPRARRQFLELLRPDLFGAARRKPRKKAA